MRFNNKSNPISIVLEGLFHTYSEHVPDVQKITSSMIDEHIVSSQEDIVNDHIAFRTLGLPHLGIASLEKIFLYFGYKKEDSYRFEHKKLNAYWYSPPESEFPRIFISELRVPELSEKSQEILTKYTSHIKKDPTEEVHFDNPTDIISFFSRPLWDLPTLNDYNELLAESEYAAWVIYNRYYLNHYTISVHELPEPFNRLTRFNVFLEEIGIKLNTSGGKIKTSPDGLLLQSSSVAQWVSANFSCGNSAKIAGSYVEFAERKLFNGNRREGFETGNADKIFESTFQSQKQ